MSGLLVTMTEPPPEMEEEINAWYDTEHIPERVAVPGFLNARRYSRDEAPRYLALYDVDQPEVFDSEAYCVYFEGRRRTVWTARMGSKFRSVDRRVYAAAGPEVGPAGNATSPHMLVCPVAANEADSNRAALLAIYERCGRAGSRVSARLYDGIPPNSEFARNIANRSGRSGAGERMLLCSSSDRAALDAVELGALSKSAWRYDAMPPR